MRSNKSQADWYPAMCSPAVQRSTAVLRSTCHPLCLKCGRDLSNLSTQRRRLLVFCMQCVEPCAVPIAHLLRTDKF
jgi:hypothetical protein